MRINTVADEIDEAVRVRARQDRMRQINELVGDLDVYLSVHGFERFRGYEFLHPGGRHIRKNYASGEWLLMVSQREGLKYRPIETIRLDSRSDKPLPTPPELAARLAP